MKKILLSALMLTVGYGFGQTILNEDFESSSSLPSGWTQYNVDGRTPDGNIQSLIGNNAWAIVDWDDEYGNVALSTSWYSPAGQSDDWIVTPALSIPADGDFFLKYDIKAQDPSFPDNYELWVTTAGNTVDDFLNSGTILIQETPTPGEWVTKSTSLGGYSGQTIYLAWRNVANDMFLLLLDKIKVYAVVDNNASLDVVNHNRFSMPDTDNSLTYVITNQGGNAITSMKIEYFDGENTVTEDISVNIAPSATQNVTIPVPLNYSGIVEKSLTHQILEVNNVADADPSDNIQSSLFNTITHTIDRNVLFEEGTGTWCGWCTRGFVAMDYMNANYPGRFIGIAVHNGDPMAVSEYDNAAGINAFPGANVDRVMLNADVGDMEWVQYFNQRKNVPTMTEVDGIITIDGNAISVSVNATFNTKISNASVYRLGVIMVENGVTGTSSNYAQANYYSGGSYGSMGGYESLPDPVPASQMVYDHVGRALLGGYSGQSGSIPSSITETTTANHVFNYTVPASQNIDNMYAVAVVINTSTGEIMNAAIIGDATTAVESEEIVDAFNVYPNPASDMINIHLNPDVKAYNVTVYDLSGREVLSHALDNGTAKTTLDVSSLSVGTYFVAVSSEKASYTKQIIIK